jgi:hypothetical protein
VRAIGVFGMFDIQTISITIVAASVVAGVIYYSFQIRYQMKVRQTDLIIRLYSLATSRDFLEAWEKIRERTIENPRDYREKYGSFIEISQVNTVLGGLGMLLQRKLINLDLVDDLTGGIAVIAWEKLRPINEHIKKERGLKSDSFDYLYDELKRLG